MNLYCAVKTRFLSLKVIANLCEQEQMVTRISESKSERVRRVGR